MSSEKRECERLARIAQNRLDAAPVIEALRDRGLAIDSVADLFNMKMNYRRAVPVLIEWLPVVTNDDVKSDIVRALSVEWAKGTAAPKLLVTEFEEPKTAPEQAFDGRSVMLLSCSRTTALPTECCRLRRTAATGPQRG